MTETNKSQLTMTMIIVMITSFITPFMGNAINLAIPAIGPEFGNFTGNADGVQNHPGDCQRDDLWKFDRNSDLGRTAANPG